MRRSTQPYEPQRSLAIVIIGLAILFAGCINRIGQETAGENQPPSVAPLVTTLDGTFILAAQVGANGEYQYVADGERSLELPTEAISLAVTLEWASPVNSEYSFQLGADGRYIGPEVRGPSPQAVVVNDSIPPGEITFLVRPANAAAADAYQEFSWEAQVVRRAT